MRISLRWLQDYVDIQDLSPEQIADHLTQLGLEVDAIEKLEPLKGEVVVGEILKAERHPNADKLQVCQVNVGGGEPLHIVCGAPNARPGIKVVVAQIGAVLPGDFKIKESKIRGENSFGMLCSEKELGLSDDHGGLIELSAKIPVGQSVSDLFRLNDTIIEIGLTPNRSDCLGAIGVARDIAARLKRPLQIPSASPAGIKVDLDSTQHITVSVDDDSDCDRFVALYIRGVRAVPSPLWLQKRILNLGMRPINLIVDATNYVMLESGQPIHAYDERDLAGAQLKVRRARAGEELNTLDGQSRKLLADDIVIADQNKAVGLAGIMGGAQSEVKTDTQNIIIEVAHFNPVTIRKTARRLAIHTEASHRFERGIDIENLLWVAHRVAEIIFQACVELRADGVDVPLPEVASRVVDQYPLVHSAKHVALRVPRLRKITALSTISREDVIAILADLGVTLVDKKEDRLLFQVPSWRHDIEREIDLIEEVTRVYGIDKIPLKLPLMEISRLPEHPLIDFLDQNKFALANAGLSEVITFPFMDEQDLLKLGIPALHPLASAVSLANPLVEQQKLLRTTLIPGLIACVLENRRHGIQGVKLFEVARSFYEPQKFTVEPSPVWSQTRVQGSHISEKARQDPRPIERNRIAAILDQPFQVKAWNQAEQKVDFFHAKQILLQWVSAFGLADLQFEAINAEDFPWLHPGASAVVKTAHGQCLGYLGQLHPRTAKAYELDFQNPPVVFELDPELLLEASKHKRSYASGTAKFPPVSRDLALVVTHSVTYNDFVKSFAAFKCRKYLREQSLFDVYQGQNMEAGKKSMAFSLIFQSDEKTLTDNDVEKELEALLNHLRDDLAAELR